MIFLLMIVSGISLLGVIAEQDTRKQRNLAFVLVSALVLMTVIILVGGVA